MAEPADERRRLRSVVAAASAWDVNPATVRRWIALRLVRSVKLGRRRLIPTSEIERVAEQGL